MKTLPSRVLPFVSFVLALAACSSSSSSGGSTSTGQTGADAGTQNEDSGTFDTPDTSTGSHVSALCVTSPSNHMQCGGFLSSASPSGSVCLGSAALCGTTPSSLTYTVALAFAVPLTATLLRCDLGESSCVPAMNEGNGDLNAVTLTFGAPNGNVGPMTTLVLQQVGSSVGATCPGAVVADATHFKVEDTYGNYTIVPFEQGGCCAVPAGTGPCQ